MTTRLVREAVRAWNEAYAEQTAAMFAASQLGPPDATGLLRLARAYVEVSHAWRTLSTDFAVPLWARHAASIAAEEFIRRAQVERNRATRAHNHEGA